MAAPFLALRAHVHSIYVFEMNAGTGRPWAVLGLGVHLTPIGLEGL